MNSLFAAIIRVKCLIFLAVSAGSTGRAGSKAFTPGGNRFLMPGSQFGNPPLIERVEVEQITSDPQIDFNIAQTTVIPVMKQEITSLTAEDLHMDVEIKGDLSTDAYIVTPPPRVCDSAYGPGAKLFSCTTPLPAVTIV